MLVPDLPIRITHMLPDIRPDVREPLTGAPLPTQDDIGLTSRHESAFVAPDANDVLTEARRSLRDVLPPPVHHEHAWAASLVHCRVDGTRVLHALQLHAGTSQAHGGDADVRVHVQDRYLSVAGVVTLLDDGALRTGAMPLHTGRYVHVTIREGGDLLASLWMPIVPVFRVSAKLVA
jgi:hypothetical protein